MSIANVSRPGSSTPARLTPIWQQDLDLKTYAPRDRRLTLKDVLDRCAALMLFVLTLPLMAVLVVVVRLTSPGPAIYSQIRIGRHGKLFPLHKFRSMYHKCEQKSGAVWASKRDGRVTPLGKFLRFTHLDELPQLVNVLRGEMSLVGPRPERPEITAKLRREFPQGYYKRLLVKPGITGLAQIRQHADCGVDDVHRKLRYDLLYVRRMSVWLDVRLIVGTLLMITRIVDHRTRARRRGEAPAVQPPSTDAKPVSVLAP